MTEIKSKRLESRSATRCHIFNIIFQLEFLGNDNIFDRLKRYYEIIETEKTLENDMNYLLNKEIIFKYINEIFQNFDFINEKIQKFSIGWQTSRISKVDLAILRLSIYEIIFNDDIPNKVAINEAIEIAKAYSIENSPKFINGILAKVLNEVSKIKSHSESESINEK